MEQLKKIIKRIFCVRNDSRYYYFTFLGVKGRVYSQKLELRSIRSRLQHCLREQEETRNDTHALLAKTETMEQQLAELAKKEEKIFKNTQRALKKSDEILSQDLAMQERNQEQFEKQQAAWERNEAAISKIASSKKPAAGSTGFLRSCSYLVEPEKLLSNQFSGEEFDAYDVIIKYMVIEEMEGIRNGGIALYEKLYAARGLDSIYTLERFQSLVESFKGGGGFILDKPIEVNSSGLIMDGAHRLACALYFKCPFVSASVRAGKEKTRNFALNYFTEHGFSKDEIDGLTGRQKELLYQSGCDIAAVLWANTEQSRIAFEELLCKQQKLRIIKGKEVLFLREQLSKVKTVLNHTALESGVGIDDIFNIYGSESERKTFYIYWCEASHSNPKFDSHSGGLVNERVKNFQRSLHLNITEDEAARKNIRLWWAFNTDVLKNQALIAQLEGLETCETDAHLRQEIYSLFYSKKQQFGRGQLYQSFPALGIAGQRPTEVRLAEYGVYDILKSHFSVLDIGCNCGFLDMTVAKGVSEVTGVDSNESLIQIGKLTAEYLKIHNVSFTAVDFAGWEAANNEKYDVIFSFAVHYWLKTTPDTYTKQLYQMLNEGGYVFFESQRMDTIDTNFDEYCQAFKDLGMRVIKEGKIKDDGIIERRYLVFQK